MQQQKNNKLIPCNINSISHSMIHDRKNAINSLSHFVNEFFITSQAEWREKEDDKKKTKKVKQAKEIRKKI